MYHSNTLIQISDCHINTTSCLGVDTVAMMQKMVSHIGKNHVDGLIATGDLVHTPSVDNYQILLDFFDNQLGKQIENIVVIPGNHDDKSALKHCLTHYHQPYFDLENWRIIFIDSVVENTIAGTITPEELKRLTKQLDQSSQSHIMLALHHPIVSMQSSWDDSLSLNNAKALFDVIAPYANIKAITWGHSHEYKVFNKNNIKLYSCPSAVKQFNQTTPYQGAYLSFKLFGDGRITHQLCCV